MNVVWRSLVELAPTLAGWETVLYRINAPVPGSALVYVRGASKPSPTTAIRRLPAAGSYSKPEPVNWSDDRNNPEYVNDPKLAINEPGTICLEENSSFSD
jgi:hypothetical protein